MKYFSVTNYINECGICECTETATLIFNRKLFVHVMPAAMLACNVNEKVRWSPLPMLSFNQTLYLVPYGRCPVSECGFILQEVL